MSTASAPPAPASGALRPGTLSRHLILAVTALVAGIAILLSALTVLIAHRVLEGQLDQQLASVAARVRGDGRGLTIPGGPGGPGQAQGLLFYVQGQGGVIQLDRDRTVVHADIAETLEDVPDDRRVTSVTLPGLGGYRLHLAQHAGHTLIVGLPTAPLAASMGSIIAAAAVLTGMSIVIAFLAARALVERSLRPLARLAATANQVSGLALHAGEVAVPVRVPAADADPRSEVGQVGQAFNHMLDNVEGALAARQRSETRVRQFVADASHELRNPLTSIRGYAELTRRERDQVPEATAHALGRIESESARMSRLVEDLLLLARLDAGPAIAVVPTALGGLVTDAVADARVAGPDHGWTLGLPSEEVVVLGDSHRLTQVVTNLLANARTHTPPGTQVHTTLAAADGTAVITVSDDGPGIPPPLQDRVFERFARADASRVRAAGGPSTGLGLAIVSAVVAAHRGSVTLDSTPGEGTTVTVRLPLA